MAIIERKCAKCKQKITIEKDNIFDVLYFDKSYYHRECFTEMCDKKSQSKRGNPSKWKEALENICTIEINTREMLEQNFAKNELNEGLLANYDITAVPGTFWQLIADLENGIYKRKKCKSISMHELLGCWKWGQRKLNEIAARNKTSHTGPQNDVDRLRYDLAILVDKFPLYLKKKTKTEENEARIKEAKEKVVKTNIFNYEALSKQAVSNARTESNNILDLMNEIF